MELIVVPFHLDQRVDGLPLMPEPAELISPSLPEADPWHRMAVLYEQVARAVARAQRPVVVSGDCTTSLGVIAGLQRRNIDPVVVWFDAHGDFNTGETSPSGYAGGMPVAVLVGRGDQTVISELDIRPLAEDHVVLVDARDLDPLERQALQLSRVGHVRVADLVPAALPNGLIYVHLDLDVLRPSALPGLRFPVTGGPDLTEVTVALGRLSATGRIAAIGLACTLHPELTDVERLGTVLRHLLTAVSA